MDLKHLLLITVYFSLMMQALTGAVDVSVLLLPGSKSTGILHELLIMETLVQVVESVFYIWLAYHFNSVSNITYKRYYDWLITTPTMLISFCLYLNYLKGGASKNKDGFLMTLYKERRILIPVFILNGFMLIFGLLGELGVINRMFAISCGFVPFIAYFYLIYQEYAKYTTLGTTIFWVFAAVWSLYGITATFSYYWKNISYNILDLISKNFFGLFLAYVIYIQSYSYKPEVALNTPDTRNTIIRL
jgi:bacteriorhodopsin